MIDHPGLIELTHFPCPCIVISSKEAEVVMYVLCGE
jgi:hypothetical protein